MVWWTAVIKSDPNPDRTMSVHSQKLMSGPGSRPIWCPRDQTKSRIVRPREQNFVWGGCKRREVQTAMKWHHGSSCDPANRKHSAEKTRSVTQIQIWFDAQSSLRSSINSPQYGKEWIFDVSEQLKNCVKSQWGIWRRLQHINWLKNVPHVKQNDYLHCELWRRSWLTDQLTGTGLWIQANVRKKFRHPVLGNEVWDRDMIFVCLRDYTSTQDKMKSVCCDEGVVSSTKSSLRLYTCVAVQVSLRPYVLLRMTGLGDSPSTENPLIAFF